MTGSRATRGGNRSRSRRLAALAGVLLRNEALKTRKRPAFWVVSSCFAAFVGIATAALSTISADTSLPMGWTMVPRGAPSVGLLCFGLAVALLFAPEFKWRTIRQGVIDGLAKEAFFAGKLLSSALLALWLAGVAWSVAAAALLVVPPAGGTTPPSAADLQAWAGLGLGMAVWGSAAFCVAATTRSGGAAVGVFLAYYFVEELAAAAGAMLAAGRGYDLLADAIMYLPGRVAKEIASHQLHYGQQFGPPDLASLFETRGFAPLAGAAAAYVVVFVAASFADFRRRDL